MKEQNEQKLTEEIKSLKSERLVNLFKGVAILIGSIVLFIAIQRPESILNRKLSQETISREREKLVFELTQQNKDPEEVLFGLSIIEKAYPEENSGWISDVKKLYNTKLQGELNKVKINQLDSIYQERLYQSRMDFQNLLDKKEKYQFALLAEVDGSAGSGIIGYGPRAKQLSEMISETEKQITELQMKIDEMEYEIKKNINTATNNEPW